MYVPILSMLQELLKKEDVLEQILQLSVQRDGKYETYRDGVFCKGNMLLSSEDLKLAIQLYIDDFKVANPLGTSKKIHKMCCVYWTLTNIQYKHWAALHTIQLGLHCNSNDLKNCVYEKVFEPLLNDLRVLESDGVFVECVGENVHGTLLCVVADNLAAHGIAEFKENFSGPYTCRFCYASKDEIQRREATAFELRTKESHDQLCTDTENGNVVEDYGVKLVVLHSIWSTFIPQVDFLQTSCMTS